MADLNLSIPRGICTSKGHAPYVWTFPMFYITDTDGNYLNMIAFEDVYPGEKTSIKELYFLNRSSGNVTVTITGGSSFDTSISDIETKEALYLSTNGIDYNRSIEITVAGWASQKIYVYWRPPSTALPGNRTFLLTTEYSDADYGLWDNVSSFTVESNSTINQTDVRIDLTIPYTAGRMATDFSDIQFYDHSFLLEHTIDSKVDEDHADFIIKIPLLYAGQEKPINVLSGNGVVGIGNYDLSSLPTPDPNITTNSLSEWDDLGYGIVVMGMIEYEVQILPELENTINYMIKIEDVIYSDILSNITLQKRVNNSSATFNVKFNTPLAPDEFRAGNTFEFIINDSTQKDTFTVFHGIIETIDRDTKNNNMIYGMTCRDEGRLLLKQPFNLDCEDETTKYTYNDILKAILKDTNLKLGRGLISIEGEV